MKFGLRAKVVGASLLIVLLLIGISVFAIINLKNIDLAYSQIANERIGKVTNSFSAQKESLNMAYAARGYMLYGRDEYIDEFEKGHKKFTEHLNSIQGTVRTETGKKLFDDAIVKEKEYYTITHDLLVSKKNGASDSEVQAKLALAAKVSKPITEAAEAFTAFQEKRLREDNAATTSKAQKTIILLAVSSGVAALIGVFISLFLAGWLTRPILAVSEQAKLVASGDLTVDQLKIKTGDELEELSNSFNLMVEYLKNTVTNLKETAGQLAMAAEQISAGTEEAAAASQDQAGQTEKVSTHMQDSAAVMEEISAGTQEMAAGAENATKIALDGEEVVSETLGGMQEISRKVENLKESSEKIKLILTVIGDIADQTNLLSLNAAIEAARAGEQGRGFAVVAEEVRKLAERSAQSTKEIAEIVQEIEKEIVGTVSSAKGGVELTDRANTAFKNIKDIVLEISKAVGEISGGIQQQALSSNELVRTADELNSLISTNASIAEETAAQAGTLSQMSSNLNGLVEKFKLS